MKSNSVIEISRSAIQENIAFIKTLLADSIRISSVVKADAYGHGINHFVPVAEACGIDHFSVFSADEARSVKDVLKNDASDIMIMGHIDDHDYEWVLNEGVEFFVFSFHRLEKVIQLSEKLGVKAKIHIEIETGLNRTGFEQKDLKKLFSLLKTNGSKLEIKGLCTHYAGAESIANHLRIQRQISLFKRTANLFEKHGIKPEYKHTACSAATITYEKTRMDLVRIGILQYGFWPSDETRIHYLHTQAGKFDPLRRVLSWRSHIMAVKSIKTGEFVGYGTTFLAQEDKTIAIVPVGYSHGYSRTLSNQGQVLVCGLRCSVIGFINMNMMIIDVTGIDEVKAGDEVVLIGNQRELTITVHSFSQLSDQLNYELLTRLPSDIPRILIE